MASMELKIVIIFVTQGSVFFFLINIILHFYLLYCNIGNFMPRVLLTIIQRNFLYVLYISNNFPFRNFTRLFITESSQLFFHLYIMVF